MKFFELFRFFNHTFTESEEKEEKNEWLRRPEKQPWLNIQLSIASKK